MLPTGQDSIDVWPKDALVCLQVVQGGVQPGSKVGHGCTGLYWRDVTASRWGSINIFEFDKRVWERGSNYFGGSFRWF